MELLLAPQRHSASCSCQGLTATSCVSTCVQRRWLKHLCEIRDSCTLVPFRALATSGSGRVTISARWHLHWHWQLSASAISGPPQTWPISTLLKQLLKQTETKCTTHSCTSNQIEKTECATTARRKQQLCDLRALQPWRPRAQNSNHRKQKQFLTRCCHLSEGMPRSR